MATKGKAYHSGDYNKCIGTILPYYQAFHTATVDLVKAICPAPAKWLDTGCGTGNLLAAAAQAFPHTDFVLADPSEEMLAQAKLAGKPVRQVLYHLDTTGDLTFADGAFDVISAIQCHHYLDVDGRRSAVQNCMRMLRPGGVLVVFETIRPLSALGLQYGLARWESYQLAHGRDTRDVEAHKARFDTEYFPITVPQHLELLGEVGFRCAEVLWASQMQAGFYAVK